MRQPGAVFEELDFIYLPSQDVAAELTGYVDGLGAEVVYAIERFETRVAQLRMPGGGPKLLLAQHLHGEQPVLIYRVPDLGVAEAELARRGMTVSERFGFPDGDAVEIELPGPQRDRCLRAHPARPGRVDRRPPRLLTEAPARRTCCSHASSARQLQQYH